jgi:hypothetical protein
MCLLIAKPEGIVIPELTKLCRLATDSNPDGFGVSWKSKRGKVKHWKGIVDIEEQVKIIEQIGKNEATIHWRFGTSGGTTKINCHPFLLPDGSIVAHNGVMPIVPEAGKSDTRTIAELSDDRHEFAKLVEKYVGRSNKFTIHSPSGLEIIGEEYGYWEGGVWYSNDNWKCVPSWPSWDDEPKIPDELSESVAWLVEQYGRDSVESAILNFDQSEWSDHKWST